MEELRRLLEEIEEERNNWNERSSFTIRGYRNLSQSDLDTLVNYAERQLQTGSVSGLMEQYGPVGEILTECGVNFNSFW